MENKEMEAIFLDCVNSYILESKVTDINEPLINMGLNSVEIMDIICQLEDKFSVVFSDSDLRSIRKGNDIVACIRRLSGVSDNS